MFDQPDIRPTTGFYPYVLRASYVYTWEAEGCLWRLNIPNGFPLDGISAPRWLWGITGITPDGLGRAAALVHDFLYRYDGQPPAGAFQKQVGNDWVNVATAWSREQVDKLFANILDLSGVSQFRRRMMYRAVRLCGWIYWRN